MNKNQVSNLIVEAITLKNHLIELDSGLDDLMDEARSSHKNHKAFLKQKKEIHLAENKLRAVKDKLKKKYGISID